MVLLWILKIVFKTASPKAQPIFFFQKHNLLNDQSNSTLILMVKHTNAGRKWGLIFNLAYSLANSDYSVNRYTFLFIRIMQSFVVDVQSSIILTGKNIRNKLKYHLSYNVIILFPDSMHHFRL